MPSFIVATFQISFILFKKFKYKFEKYGIKARVVRYKVKVVRNISNCEKVNI